MTEQVGQFGVFDRTSMELITRPRLSLSLSLHDSRYARMVEERRYYEVGFDDSSENAQS